MRNDEFINMYSDYLEHRWVSSRDPAKAAQQKKREQEYNRKYYEEHKEEIRRNHRNFTPQEALDDLNEMQRKFKEAREPQGPQLPEMAAKVKEARIQDIMKRAPLLTRQDAERLYAASVARAQKEEKELFERNKRARETGIAQGEQQKANVQYKTLNRRSASDRAASNAQMENRQRANASQRRARTGQRKGTLESSSSRYKERMRNSAQVSRAMDDATRKRSEYQRSTEARVGRVISRATKKVNDIIKTTNAAAKRVSDLYNNTSKRFKNAIKMINYTIGQ